MNLVDLLALLLAVGGTVDCWLNSTIFEKYRARLEGWTLFGCDYCLNWQAPFWLLLCSYLPSLWLPSPWDTVVKLPIYGLAAAYAAWLINEVRASRECDYSRSRRETEDREDYGDTRPVVALSPAGQAESGDYTRVVRVPALFFPDGSEAVYFCSAVCQAAHAVGLDDVGTKYTMGVGPVAAGARCAQCNKSILQET